MDATIALTQQLVKQASVTPDDQTCQEILAQHLCPLGFVQKDYSHGEVKNSYFHLERDGPLLWFVGHTDVVPPGPEDEWQYPPFSATIADGLLYGRGCADMKGSLAAWVTAIECFLEEHPDSQLSLGVMVTSDEEGPAQHGIKHVMQNLSPSDYPRWCVVGEPSSTHQLGDTVKVGRRGSLSAKITFIGKQGHIAYPHLAENPIHQSFPALQALCQTQWDHGNDYFPPTSFQISNIHAGTGANNVIPGELVVDSNFRFCTENSAESLKQKTEDILKEHNSHYRIDWHLSGNPFLTQGGALVTAMSTSIATITGITPELSTAGGTSDGRFIAPLGIELLEFGPINKTIHQINENVAVEDLMQLKAIYQALITTLSTC